jgi:hypothetical protein
MDHADILAAMDALACWVHLVGAPGLDDNIYKVRPGCKRADNSNNPPLVAPPLPLVVSDSYGIGSISSMVFTAPSTGRVTSTGPYLDKGHQLV